MHKTNRKLDKVASFSFLFLGFILLFNTIGCSSEAVQEERTEDNPPTTAEEEKNESTPLKEDHAEEEDHANAVKTIPATVEKVVDGDTVKVVFEDGKEETIRLLLIDTPETVHPNKPVQPFGPEASALVKEMMPPGTEIGIELDVSERDKYGRILAYVYVGGKMVNESLLEEGLARVAYVYPPNVKYVDRFRAIQDEARQNEVGIWSIENYATYVEEK